MTPGWLMAWVQKAMLRSVWRMPTPTSDLNHCRSSSISVIRAIGVPQMCDASIVRSSKAAFGIGVEDPIAPQGGQTGRFVDRGHVVILRVLQKDTPEQHPGFGWNRARSPTEEHS